MTSLVTYYTGNCSCLGQSLFSYKSRSREDPLFAFFWSSPFFPRKKEARVSFLCYAVFSSSVRLPWVQAHLVKVLLAQLCLVGITRAFCSTFYDQHTLRSCTKQKRHPLSVQCYRKDTVTGSLHHGVLSQHAAHRIALPLFRRLQWTKQCS